MKRISFFFLTVLFSLYSFGQLNADHNSIRAGDVIVKQQVEYKSPGEPLPNQIWDFSQLKSINDEYTLSYSQAPLLGDSIYVMGYNQFGKKTSKYADLIVGTEHNTMYYFYQTVDSLLLLGHENVAIKQENRQPVVNLKFPFNYQQQFTTDYATRGLYSGVTHVTSEGTIGMHADAFGQMILPSGDTINPVLRIRSEQTIFDTTGEVILDIEDDKGRLLRSYKWYSKGYRYPIFETVECINLNDSTELFSTSFFFPPQDHLYLDTDPDNLALLDRLWEYTEDDFDSFKSNNSQNAEGNQRLFHVYPNPVVDILTIEYTLENDSPVNIIMATLDGKVVRNIFKKQQSGSQREEIDCSSFVQGTYLLKIVAGDVVMNKKILKR